MIEDVNAVLILQILAVLLPGASSGACDEPDLVEPLAVGHKQVAHDL